MSSTIDSDCPDKPKRICPICPVHSKCNSYLLEYRRILEDKYGDEADYMFNMALEKHRQDHPNS